MIRDSGDLLAKLKALRDQGIRLAVFETPPDPERTRWCTSSRTLLRSSFGEDSEHFKAFTPDGGSSFWAQKCVGVLESALESIESGFLTSRDKLIEADVFADLLGMAEHLLSSGYRQPAVSLGGAVLEDGLRRCCLRRSITISGQDDISSLSRKLFDAKFLSGLQMKQVNYWKGTRDIADHGQFEELGKISEGDIIAMIKSLPGFLDSLP